MPAWYDEMSGMSVTPPCTRTFFSYSAYKKTNREWKSLPFYSGDKGYKLELIVWPDGDTGVSLLQGENDDDLKWPLAMDITIQLLNWREDKHHLELTFRHDLAPAEACKRVIQGVRAPKSMGYQRQFITDTVLHNTDKSEYLRNDNLCFRIFSVLMFN